MKKIYLDTCAWCRPFDDASDKRIAKEAEALIRILRRVGNNEMTILSSSVLLSEVSMISSNEKRETVEELINRATFEMAFITRNSERLAEEIMQDCNINAMDAMHIAIALDNLVDIFLTTDDNILSNADCILKYGIEVKNPIEVV